MKDSLLCFLCFVILLAGCQPAEEPNTEALVQTALAETAVMQTLVVQGAAATFAAIPTETLTPTPTLTPTITPLPPVTAELVLNAYCRPGPGTVYGQGKLLEKGVMVQVIGREDEAAAWLLVQLSDSTDTCWIAKEALAVTGETVWVEIVLAPPTPTAIPNWSGNWLIWYTTELLVEYNITVTFTQTGNQLTATFARESNSTTLQGIVSANGLTVDGTAADNFSTIIQNRNFHIERDPDNPNQFRGSVGSGVPRPFCGTKISGGSKPSPCLP